MKLNAQEIYKIFVNRKDVFARQQNSGAYFPVRRPITIKDIEKHLKGEHTLGLYCLNHGNTVKWACVDIDAHDITATELRRSREDAYFIYHIFEGFDRMLENSGRRGYHVWIFFPKPVPAEYAQRLVKAKLNRQGYNKHEVFPKQTELNEGRKFGNLVKLPLGVHKKSGKRSIIIKAEISGCL